MCPIFPSFIGFFRFFDEAEFEYDIFPPLFAEPVQEIKIDMVRLQFLQLFVQDICQNRRRGHEPQGDFVASFTFARYPPKSALPVTISLLPLWYG